VSNCTHSYCPPHLLTDPPPRRSLVGWLLPRPTGGGAAAATARRTVATSRWHARQVLQTAAADADTQSLDLGSTQPPTPALQLPPSDTQQQQQQEQQQQQLQPAAGTEFECDIPGCTACFTVPGAPSVCTRCAAALFILRDKTCGACVVVFGSWATS
jgi:hypothetical protein